MDMDEMRDWEMLGVCWAPRLRLNRGNTLSRLANLARVPRNIQLCCLRNHCAATRSSTVGSPTSCLDSDYRMQIMGDTG
jgi:hypothetical protein